MNHNEFISFSNGQFSSVDSVKCLVSHGDNTLKYVGPDEQVKSREELFRRTKNSPFTGNEAVYTTQVVWLPELNDPNSKVYFDVNLVGSESAGRPTLFRAHVERTLTPGNEGSWELYEHLGVLVQSYTTTAYLHVRERVPAGWWRIKALFPDLQYDNCYQRLVWAAYNRPASS
jgi:hypothetical protein